MINIIPTLKVMDTVEEYKTMVLNYISSGSRIFRCNATRFTNEYETTLQEIPYRI